MLLLSFQVALSLHPFTIDLGADHLHAFSWLLIGWVSAERLDSQRDAERLTSLSNLAEAVGNHRGYLNGNE